MLAHDLIAAGSAGVMVAGGMESMSNAPYLLDRARAGYRMGHGRVIDHMFLDGLEDAYDKGRLMGSFAEDCAHQLPVHPPGAGRLRAHLARAGPEAIADGSFAAEMVPVTVRAGKSDRQVDAGRTAAEGQPGKNPDSAARLPRGRHGDGGEFKLDLRRRGGAGADAPLGSREARPDPAGGDRSATPPMRRRQACSPPPRSARSGGCWSAPAGSRARWTCSRSTRRSRWWRWWRCATSTCRTTR